MRFTFTGEVEVKEPPSDEADAIAGAIQTAMSEMGFHYGPGPDEKVTVIAVDVNEAT